ncbi:hypothetical protein SAMN05661080_04000 [Modestobacter sp. DSM 44400]|uniref:hypothetical protein n=1 Tax=Modestobacter sp. DSM 44400 TaxID=1550230 RepID=UPI000899D1CF|nr:hypothetical protein [Modestobacter sp. DSM 44400]SDY60205.1 hypothetical protein SAMN05661080_04000 [Modestobacter sp. DSM 44400]
MSVFGKAKAKVEELLGRAEQVYGESHGDAAATLDGEARRLEGEAEEEQADPHQAERPARHRHPDDDGLAGAR